MQMFQAVINLGALCIVEAVKRAHKVSGDPADALTFDALAHDAVMLMQSRLHWRPPTVRP